MRRLSLLTAAITVILATQADAITSFYTNVSTEGLATFNSSPLYSDILVIGAGGDTRYMDLSPDGRLFGSENGNHLYEFDPATGSLLDAMYIGGQIEGVAVADTGLVYVSLEDQYSISTVDFDARDVTNVVTHSLDIDDLDFDADGNLIGHNVNGSGIGIGKIYRIPVDGSQPQLVATMPSLNVFSMTFSDADNAFYFLTSDSVAELWRLPWDNGQPAGDMEYVKDIYAAPCFGLAAIPEPSTALLLVMAFVIVPRRQRM